MPRQVSSAWVLLAPVNQLAFAIFPLAILFFPDGRLTSARWRWVLGIYAALVAADKTIAAFAARLKDVVDLEGLRDDLTGVVHQTLEPAYLSVWIRSVGVDQAAGLTGQRTASQ